MATFAAQVQKLAYQLYTPDGLPFKLFNFDEGTSLTVLDTKIDDPTNPESIKRYQQAFYASYFGTQLITGLGLPARMMNIATVAVADEAGEGRTKGDVESDAKDAAPSWGNFFRNITGWQKDVSRGKQVWNGIKMPFVFAWHIGMMAIRIPVNVAKLAVLGLGAVGFIFDSMAQEVLASRQQALAMAGQNKEVFEKGIPQVSAQYKHTMEVALAAKAASYQSQAFGFGVLYGVMRTLQVIFLSLCFVGGAMVTPVTNILRALDLGKQIAGEGLRGKILGGVLIGLSAIITVGFYAIALPLTMHLILGGIIGVPAVVGANVSAAYTWVAVNFPGLINGLSAFYAMLGQSALAPLLQGLGSLVGTGIGMATGTTSAMSALATGLATITGAMAAIVLSVANPLSDAINNWWHRRPTVAAAQPEVPEGDGLEQALGGPAGSPAQVASAPSLVAGNAGIDAQLAAAPPPGSGQPPLPAAAPPPPPAGRFVEPGASLTGVSGAQFEEPAAQPLSPQNDGLDAFRSFAKPGSQLAGLLDD